MSAVLAALAGAAAYGAYNSISQQRQNKATKQNILLQDKLNNENMRTAPVLASEGFKNAGLNPVSASGGASFSAPAVASHPGSPGAGIDFANPLVAAVSTDNALKLQQEQMANLNAQTQHQELINTRLEDENLTLDENLRSWISGQIEKDPDNAGFYQDLLNRNEVFSKGTIDGIIDFSNLQRVISDNDMQKMSNYFFSLVKQHQLDNGLYKVIGDMPKVQQLDFFKQWSKISAEIAKLMADTDLDKAKVTEALANTDKLITESHATYHKDYAQMVRNKDYLEAGISLLGATIQAFGTGAGFGSAMYLTKGKGAKKPEAPPPDFKVGFPYPSGYSKY